MAVKEEKTFKLGSSDNTPLCKFRPHYSRILHNTHYRTPASNYSPPLRAARQWQLRRFKIEITLDALSAQLPLARGRPPQWGLAQKKTIFDETVY
jgi:hypothetical protein